MNKRKKGLQKEKKRKREDGDKEDIEEDSNKFKITDGEKVFMGTRTRKAHYLQIIKEMEHIKGIPAAILISKMIEWVLACEIRRQKSKNINGNLARQMREYLIKLFCTINEVQKQKENSEAGKLMKQMEEMKRDMTALREENKKLRSELEHIKNNVHQSSNINQKAGKEKVHANKEMEKNTGKEKENEASREGETLNNKRAPQPHSASADNTRVNIFKVKGNLDIPLFPKIHANKERLPHHWKGWNI